MEFEKTLFRVHEKLLQSEKAPTFLKQCVIVNAIFCAFFSAVFLISDLSFRGSPGVMGTNFNSYKNECLPNVQIPKDIVYSFILCDFDPEVLATEKKKFIENNNLDTCYRPIQDEYDGESLNSHRTRILTFDGEYEEKQDGENQNKDGEQQQLAHQEQQQQDGEGKQGSKSQSRDGTYYIFDEAALCQGKPILHMEMSPYDSFLKIPLEFRNTTRYHYPRNNVNVIASPQQIGGNFISRFFQKNIILYENILIFDIMASFTEHDLHIKNLNTTESWSFSREQNLMSQNNFFIKMISIFFNLVKVTLGLFLTSAITSIYIKITIICAPIFILVIIQCVNRMGNQEITRNTLYRAFPWMGMYLYSLDMQQSKIKYLVKSFLMLILLFYCVYLSSSIYISQFSFFYKSVPKGIDENFFGFQAFIEFGVLLFLRTRSSIKWFPKTTLTLIVAYLLYVQQTAYGFYYLGLYSILFGVFALFGMILYYFEVPAMCQWNPNFTFTPTTERPRTLYFPLFSMSWFYDLPQLWTMFYPLHGRPFFTESQLSLVDRNYVLLNQTIRNQNQRAMQDQNNPVMQQQQRIQQQQNPANPANNNNNEADQLAGGEVEMGNINGQNSGNQLNTDSNMVQQDSLQQVSELQSNDDYQRMNNPNQA